MGLDQNTPGSASPLNEGDAEHAVKSTGKGIPKNAVRKDNYRHSPGWRLEPKIDIAK